MMQKRQMDGRFGSFYPFVVRLLKLRAPPQSRAVHHESIAD